MLKIVKSIAIEITRRCNEACKICMRGNPQNIDISKSYIDKLLSEKVIIVNLILSGGEPTLNEELIEYIIDKIIREHLFVLSLQMTTNGFIYSERTMRAFERFYDYVSTYLFEIYQWLEVKSSIAEIRISNDQFHLEENSLYHKPMEKIKVTYTGNKDMLEDEILLTGLAKKNIPFGRYFNYKLEKIKIECYDELIIFRNNFYLTATGFITNQGDGQYNDMDIIHLAHIEDFSFEDLLIEGKKKLEYK